MNSNGYMVNGAGYYLMGIPVDPATGAPTASSPQVLQFNNNFLPAQATTSYQLWGKPAQRSADRFAHSCQLQRGSHRQLGPERCRVRTLRHSPSQSLDGGSITAYDSLGNPVNVQLRWAETASSGGNNSWQLFYQTSNATSGTTVAWQNVGTDLYVQFERPIDSRPRRAA